MFVVVFKAEQHTYLLRRCCGLPRHLNSPFTMIANLVHNVSHSSMLKIKNFSKLVLSRSLKTLQNLSPDFPNSTNERNINKLFITFSVYLKLKTTYKIKIKESLKQPRPYQLKKKSFSLMVTTVIKKGIFPQPYQDSSTFLIFLFKFCNDPCLFLYLICKILLFTKFLLPMRGQHNRLSTI